MILNWPFQVPSEHSNHTLGDFFSLSLWMSHGEEKKDGHKEHILCNSDGDGKSIQASSDGLHLILPLIPVIWLDYVTRWWSAPVLYHFSNRSTLCWYQFHKCAIVPTYFWIWSLSIHFVQSLRGSRLIPVSDRLSVAVGILRGSLVPYILFSCCFLLN